VSTEEGVVEDKNGSVNQKGPRDCDALFLAPERITPFLPRGFQTDVESTLSHHKFPRPSRLPSFFQKRLRSAEKNILFYGIGEKKVSWGT
jgi:hypothetical protein